MHNSSSNEALVSASTSRSSSIASRNSKPESHSSIFNSNEMKPLTPVEKRFLLLSERGDVAGVRKIMELYKNNTDELDINCVDSLNRSALVSAIENENPELMRLLLAANIKIKDALLIAIKEEYVEAVEMLLEWEEKNHKPGTPYSWEAMDRNLSSFTSDITPLVLAAHHNNYEILKILLDRGASLPIPHDVRCGCDECVLSREKDSLRHSQSRINAYKALTSPSLISLSSTDPLLTAFHLSWELDRLSKLETEYRADYKDMKSKCQEFATSLLDHARTSFELEIVLNYSTEGEPWNPGERHSLDRLKLAIKYKQKRFVAHPNVQQLLASIWYEGLPGFRQKSAIGQLIQISILACMFPFYSMMYMTNPYSKMGQFMKKPFVKFICHSASYLLFLGLLGMASQRIEVLIMEFLPIPWIQSLVEEIKEKERGAFPGLAETGVIVYVISLIWCEVKALWNEGPIDYISDLWNIVDFITNSFYLSWLSLRMSSWYIVQRDYSMGEYPWYPREEWEMFDPMLLSEGAFAAGMILSFLKLVHIFSINPHLGPLQVSLGRMIIDIIKFFFIYCLVLFAFGCGLNQLLWYYAELEKNKCYETADSLPDFEHNEKACFIWRRYANLFETSQSLFWASFGLVDLLTFELTGIKGFTRFWAMTLFGSYCVINIIVLLNMLIAMMSNSYQIISERSDAEWKFARSNLWISYFEEGDTVPPPFNIVPTMKNLLKTSRCCKNLEKPKSAKKLDKKQAEVRHLEVMKLLIRRYITAEQTKRDQYGITEDDVMEIRQDISTLRYELVDILHQNGMKTPNINPHEIAVTGKKGKNVERRLLKDFQIGFVEGLMQELTKATPKDANVFNQLVKVIRRKTTSKKKDWNEIVKQRGSKKDLIGSSQEYERRHSKQSLRRHILDTSLLTLDQDKLIEYNPKLTDVPPTARIAYAKFMSRKLRVDFDKNVNEVDENNSVSTSKLADEFLRALTIDEESENDKQRVTSNNVSSDNVVIEMNEEVETNAVKEGSEVDVIAKKDDGKANDGEEKKDPEKEVEDSNEKPTEKPEVKPEERPEEQLEDKPEERPEEKTTPNEDEKPEENIVTKTDEKPDVVIQIEEPENTKEEQPQKGPDPIELEPTTPVSTRSKLTGQTRTGWL